MPGPTTCTFGNTTISRGFDFTFGPGVQPSVCMLYTVPHTSGLPSVGELRFQTQGEPPFVFRDCLLEDPRLIAGEQGQFWQLPVKDRRWKWQFGYIHGSYNVPRPDGSLLRETTPKQLASLLLAAMGEAGYDVSRLPNDQRPEIQWEGSLPASELDRLCMSLGCIVVLNPINDQVELWPIGETGSPNLPNAPTRGTSYAPVIPAQPQNIRAEAGYTLFQATFATEPVGLDTDGKWKKLIDLSYTPSWGWGFAPPMNGYTKDQIPGTYSSGGRTLDKCDLASATVYRCYRVSSLSHKSPFNPGAFSPPLLDGTTFEPQTIRDLRLFDELADEEIGSDGGLRPLPAVALVKAWSSEKPMPANPIRYEHVFSLDSTFGIVAFNEPLIKFSTSTLGLCEPADVRLECAFHAGRNGQFHRHSVETNTGSGIVTPTRIVQRPEITARVIYRYSNDTTFSTTSNIPDTSSRLNYWTDAALGDYGLMNGGTVNFQVLVPFSPDGLTQQITWSGGGGRHARTTISRAQRHNRYIPPLNEYRDRLSAKRNEQLIQNFALQSALKFIGGGMA